MQRPVSGRCHYARCNIIRFCSSKKIFILQSKLADTSRIKIKLIFPDNCFVGGGAPIKNKNFSIPTTTLKVGSSCWGGPVLCFLVAYINLWRGGGSHAKTWNNSNKWNGGKLINLKTVTLPTVIFWCTHTWHSSLNGVSWYVRNIDSFAQSTILLLGQSLPSVPAIYLRYLRSSTHDT